MYLNLRFSTFINLLSIVLSLKIPENIYVRLCYHFQITDLGVLAETSEKKHFMIMASNDVYDVLSKKKDRVNIFAKINYILKG